MNVFLTLRGHISGVFESYGVFLGVLDTSDTCSLTLYSYKLVLFEAFKQKSPFHPLAANAVQVKIR